MINGRLFTGGEAHSSLVLSAINSGAARDPMLELVGRMSGLRRVRSKAAARLLFRVVPNKFSLWTVELGRTARYSASYD